MVPTGRRGRTPPRDEPPQHDRATLPAPAANASTVDSAATAPVLPHPVLARTLPEAHDSGRPPRNKTNDGNGDDARRSPPTRRTDETPEQETTPRQHRRAQTRSDAPQEYRTPCVRLKQPPAAVAEAAATPAATIPTTPRSERSAPPTGDARAQSPGAVIPREPMPQDAQDMPTTNSATGDPVLAQTLPNPVPAMTLPDAHGTGCRGDEDNVGATKATNAVGVPILARTPEYPAPAMTPSHAHDAQTAHNAAGRPVLSQTLPKPVLAITLPALRGTGQDQMTSNPTDDDSDEVSQQREMTHTTPPPPQTLPYFSSYRG